MFFRFFLGTKLLYKDIQMYLTVSKELKNGKPVDKLSREQLEVFYKVNHLLLTFNVNTYCVLYGKLF